MCLFLLQRCWKPQVKWQSEAGRSAPLGQTCCAGGSRNKEGEDGGVRGHGRGDVWGRGGGEAVPVSWLFGPRSVTHTHTHTHEFHRFGGRNRQTGKKGAKTVYSSHSEPYTANQRYPNTAASESQGGEVYRCVVAINTTGCDGFLDLPWFPK